MEYRAFFNSNRELWQQLKNGNIQAMGELFNRNFSYLVAYGLKIIPSREIVFDSIQEVYLNIWNSRENLGDVCNVVAYLFKALRNELFRQAKLKNRFASMQDDFSNDPLRITFAIEDLLVQREIAREIHEFLLQALNKLTPRQKEAIYLKFYFGMSNDEIGEIMGLQNQTVRNTLSEALKLLRQITTVSAS